MPERVVNFSDATEKSKVLSYIRTLGGKYRVLIAKDRQTRSKKQNAYLWGVAYPFVASGLQEAWGETLNNDEVHEFLKDRFLSKPVVNRKNGELMGKTKGSSKVLNTKEFTEYLEQIFKFSAESLGVTIPLPNEDVLGTKGQDHGRRV